MLTKCKLLVLAVVALALVACGKKEEPVSVAPVVETATTEPKVLNVYNWPDYIPERMIPAFEKETGIKVNYDTFETNEALHAKLVAGNTGYDIVVPGSTFAKSQIEAGFFQPLDFKKIPNHVNLHGFVKTVLSKADLNNEYLVPWAWSFTTVGINKTKVEKALGGMAMPENAWDLVFKPQYTGKLKSCGIAYLDSPTEIIPVALHYIGKDAYSNNPADYKLATDMLAKVRKDVRLFSSTMIDDIASGKVCAVIGWAGDINLAAKRAADNQSIDVIEALLPSTGALSFFDTMAILKDAKHPNNAHAFINFFLRPENGAAMANEMSDNTGNKASIALVTPETVANKLIFVEASYMPRMVHPVGWSSEARVAMTAAFNDFKKGGFFWDNLFRK